MITKKSKEAGTTGRLSTWPVPVGYFFPEFSTEVAMNMIDRKLSKVDIDSLKPVAKKVAGVDVYFDKMKPELDNYYLIVMDSIFY